jgi:hypothetical protein
VRTDEPLAGKGCNPPEIGPGCGVLTETAGMTAARIDRSRSQPTLDRFSIGHFVGDGCEPDGHAVELLAYLRWDLSLRTYRTLFST